jgi:hypothetical protein
MKNLIVILLLASLQTLYLPLTSNAQNGTLLTGKELEQRLNEDIDVNLVLESLTKRTLRMAKEFNRFTLLSDNRFSALFDTYSDYFDDESTEESNSEEIQESDATLNVIILPFISSATEAAQPELWEKSISLAKQTNADYLFAGVLDQATAEPIEQEGNNANVKIYVGFEGTVVFRIKLFDLNNGEELETKEISDTGILNSKGVKLGQKLLATGGKLGHFTGSSNALTTRVVSNQVNDLIDSAHPKTKQDAIYAAINRTDKYLKKAVSENFPAYFPYQSHNDSNPKKLEITFKNTPDSDIIVGHILEIITKNEGKEVLLEELVVKEVNENDFVVSGNPKNMDNLSEQLEKDPEAITAKLGKEKKNTKAKISGLIKTN